MIIEHIHDGVYEGGYYDGANYEDDGGCLLQVCTCYDVQHHIQTNGRFVKVICNKKEPSKALLKKYS